ncbi:hypothetical protein E2C01_083003 [Portunus trituberculatus]|uniref:Uncharacterized protein n=1 Tax=Portunus trituberculatus TaxID=210409 RepID=A0A5B7ITS2_PORTR|nr:hypothetical protein [Portunus trituberculatus]
MHVMCCNKFTVQCIPLFHCSVWKSVCPSFLCVSLFV